MSSRLLTITLIQLLCIRFIFDVYAIRMGRSCRPVLSPNDISVTLKFLKENYLGVSEVLPVIWSA